MEVQKGPYTKENIEFFSQDIWKKLYPEKQVKLRSFYYPLHFAIAFDKPFKEIHSLTLTQRNVILADPQNYNLTPLHIATLKAKGVEAVTLVSAVTDPKPLIHAQDKGGFTPLQIAAITSDSLYQFFINSGADPKLTTKDGMSSEELRVLAGRVNEIRSKNTLFIEHPYTGELILVSESSEKLKERVFGKNFYHTDSQLFDLEQFQNLWLSNLSNTNHEFVSKYEVYKKNPPKIVIANGCRALEKIPRGTMVTEYAGKKVFPKNLNLSETVSEFDYQLETIDAKHVGNEARFFQCGFPNMVLETCIINGNKRHGFIALEDIEAGEALLFDHGIDMSYLAYKSQVLLGKEKMKNIDTSKTDTNPQAEFVLNCPTALLYLHFHNIVDASFWSKCLENDEMFKNWKQKHLGSLVHLWIMLDIIKGLNKNVMISAWVLDKLEKMPVIDILKGIDLLKKNTNLREIDTFLKSYDWDKDPKHPFNIKRKLQYAAPYYEILSKFANAADNKKKNINKLILKKLTK